LRKLLPSKETQLDILWDRNKTEEITNHIIDYYKELFVLTPNCWVWLWTLIRVLRELLTVEERVSLEKPFS
jgi:hypothetical protein